MDLLKGKKIVLGVTGSIAAYKSVLLAREFVKRGAEVQVVMTPSAKEFVTMLTFSTLTSKPVVSEFFSRRDGTWNSHVDLGLWADAMLVAPASASTIGKMANGIADNMLLTTYLSMRAPVFVAPAMDADMFAHQSTQRNIARLRSYGNIIIEPGVGELASSLVGKGRMEEPGRIIEIIESYFQKPLSLAGKKILVTAGPTYEKIDPVRFIANRSSGKMGFALAEECARRGADVVLVTGPVAADVSNTRIRRIDVESAQEMHDAVLGNFAGMDAAILCAAVSDYRVEHCPSTKMKRTGSSVALTLVPTNDIAKALGKAKKEGQLLVGFALETDNETENAKRKLIDKNLDFIVLNSLNDKDACFGTDTNKVTIIGRDFSHDYPLKHKAEVATDIVDMMESHIKKGDVC